jgi:hypothetical protein
MEVRWERFVRHCARDWYMCARAVKTLPEFPGSGCIVSADHGQAYGGTGMARRNHSARE